MNKRPTKQEYAELWEALTKNDDGTSFKEFRARMIKKYLPESEQ